MSDFNRFTLNFIKYFSSFSILLIIIICFQVKTEAQTKSNLELLYTLLDSASILIDKKLPESDDEISLSLSFGINYDVLKNYCYSSITTKNKNLNVSLTSKLTRTLNITLDEAKIEYPDNFRDGFFGDFFTIRKAEIKGSYLLNSKQVLNERFVFEVVDTINTADLQHVENYSYPFTIAEKPGEPFFSSLFEPIVAVGTTAIAVILFFTIRSK